MSATPILFKDTSANKLDQCLHWSWQQVTSRTIRSSTHLTDLLDLSPDQLPDHYAASDFPLKVPLTFVRKMRKGDANDPLLLQVLAQAREDQPTQGYVDDPLEEHQTEVPGLIRKYPGRALLTAATACPIHCRYCFRRHFPYQENQLSPSSWATALQAIREDSTLSEIILSGGEPLMMKDSLLASLLNELDQIPHLSLIRIHSRFPVAVPQRLSRSLLDILDSLRCRVTLVLHVNHPNEIDEALCSHLQPFARSSITLLNQSTLLRNINDDARVLNRLSRQLHAAGVLPYYLHALDPVRGAAHFDVPDSEAVALIAELQDQLPGYLLPTLVREVPDRLSKVRLAEL